MKKKIAAPISFILVISLLITSATAIKFDWKNAFLIAKWLIYTAGDTLYECDPETQEGSTWCASSSGTIKFGNKEDEARRVRREINVDEDYNFLHLFAETSITSMLTAKINIFLENSNGDEVYGGVVGHEQFVVTDYLDWDDYEAYFVSSDKKWNCWVYRYDNTNQKTQNIQINPEENYPFIFDMQNRRVYRIPSQTFQNIEKNKINKFEMFESECPVLNSQELINEFYDDSTGYSVKRLKHFDVGDMFFVKDIISNITYDSNTNVSIIYFGENEHCFEWPFIGDLRDRFNIGEKLTFKFKVCEEYNSGEYAFESLNYFVDSYEEISKNSAVSIDNYIVT